MFVYSATRSLRKGALVSDCLGKSDVVTHCRWAFVTWAAVQSSKNALLVVCSRLASNNETKRIQVDFECLRPQSVRQVRLRSRCTGRTWKSS